MCGHRADRGPVEQQTQSGVFQKIKNTLCNNSSPDALQEVSGALSDLGTGADLARPLTSLAGAGAAVSGGPYAAADEFMTNLLSQGLELVGNLGTGGTAVSAFGDLSSGDVGNAIYDVADFYVYKGLVRIGSGGSGEAAAGAAVLGVGYYLLGGSKGIIQSALCK